MASRTLSETAKRSLRASEQAQTKKDQQRRKAEQKRQQEAKAKAKAAEQKRQQEAKLKQEEAKLKQKEAELKQQLQQLKQQEAKAKAKAEQQKEKVDPKEAKLKQQIQQLKQQKKQSMGSVPWTYTESRVVLDEGKTTFDRHGYPINPVYKRIDVDRRYDRAQRKVIQNRIGRKFNSKIDDVSFQLREHMQQKAVSESNLPDWVKQKALRTYNPVEFHETSALQIARDIAANAEIQALHARRSSITTAQSEAVKEREALEFKIREFEKQKDADLSRREKIEQQQRLKDPDVGSSVLTRAKGKKQPTIKDSSFFMESEDFASPQSIRSKTQQQSAQVVQKFSDIQKGQSDLFFTITGAPSSKQAVKLRQQARRENPYLGTANILKKGGVTTGSYGVLVEKRLGGKFPDDTISSDRARSQAPSSFQSSKPIATPDQTLQPVQQKAPDPLGIEKIPYYQVIDEQTGQAREGTPEELFRIASGLVEKKPPTPSNVDLILSQYIQDNTKNIRLAEITREKQKSGQAVDILTGFPFERAFLNYGTELRASIQNIFRPESEQEKFTPSLESLAFSDVSDRILYSIDPENNPPPGPSRTAKEIKEKIQTPEGKQQLAGTVTGSLVVGGASLLIPPLGAAKFSQWFIKPKTARVAETIAQKLRETPESQAIRKTLEKIPDLTPKQKEGLIRKSGTQKPVSVELIGSRTALITRGTELAEEKTPSIIVNVGRKGKAQLFEVADTDKPGQFKEIMISGTQRGELDKGITQTSKTIKGKTIKPAETGKQGQPIPQRIETSKLKDEIVSYPGTRDNILKATKTEELAPVGTKKEVLTEDLIKDPKAVIKSVEDQPVKSGSIIAETKRLDPKRAVEKQLKKTEASPEELLKKPKPKTSLDRTFETKPIDIETPKPKSPTLAKPKPTQQGKIKDVSRQLAKAQTDQPFNIKSAQAGVIAVEEGIRSRTKPAQDSISLAMQDQPQKSIQAQATQPKVKTETVQKSDVIQKQQDQIKIDLEELQKTKPVLDPKYSLIVTPGQKQKTGTVPIFRIVTKQKQTTVPRIPPTEPKKPFVPRPPGAPVLSLDLGEKDLVKDAIKKGRLRVGYFRTNVNLGRVGGYLPTPSIVTGRSPKVISRVDKFERKFNTQRYADRINKRVSRFFDPGLDKKKRRIEEAPKSRIFNISKPAKSKQQKRKEGKSKNFLKLRLGF